MIVYEILDDNGKVINTINASEEFVKTYYANHWRERFEPDIQTWIITKLAMISRFTTEEYIGIVSATKTDPAVQAWYDLFQVTSAVNLQDKRCKDGINSFVAKNLLTQARADEILNTPAAPSEIPA